MTLDGSGLPPPWGGNKNVTGAATTSYNAQNTTVTDQAGHVRMNLVDGLGRLTQVQEDPGSAPHLNYLTLYGYDALNDLTAGKPVGAYADFQLRFVGPAGAGDESGNGHDCVWL